MRIRIVEHRSKETEEFLGYEIQYKPFWWWPGWKRFDGLPWLKTRYEAEQDTLFVLSCEGIIKTKKEFH